MLLQEFIHQRTVWIEQIAGAIAHTAQIVEGDYGQKFGWMHRTPVCEIDDLPHPRDQIRLRQNPTAANTAEPVRFGQAAGDYEV
jgi:hypothetical protein